MVNIFDERMTVSQKRDLHREAVKSSRALQWEGVGVTQPESASPRLLEDKAAIYS